MNKGKMSGYSSVIFSFLIWGFLPIYWKAMLLFSASDILSHRIIWSFVFLSFLLFYYGNWKDFFRNFSSLHEIVLLVFRAFSLGANWFIYVWGINHDYVIECSFGYFIMPIVIVFLGFLFLKEKLSILEIISFFLALLGVLNLVLHHGKFPWLALSISVTFAIYTLLRKTSRHGPISGLSAEVAILSIPAFAYLLLSGIQNRWIHYKNISFIDVALILGTGIVTVVPLLFYINGIRKVKLSVAGMLNYISPTCTFILGILVYKEKFSFVSLITFLLIWMSIMIFSYDRVKKVSCHTPKDLS